MITCTVKGVLGTGGCPRSLRDYGFQLFVAMGGSTTFFFYLRSRYCQDRHRPTKPVLFGWKGFHIHTYLCYQSSTVFRLDLKEHESLIRFVMYQMGAADKTSRTGNVIVMGGRETGKTA